MRRLAVMLAAAALATGCGDDDERAATTDTRPTETTAPTDTREERTTDTETDPTETATSPEDQPGGAGDEVPAQTPALVTGRGGRLSPREIRVPPYIAVGLELRSSDGRGYAVRVAGRELSVGSERRRASLLLDGLRPDRRYVVRPTGGGPPVVIVASAEPGP